MKKHFLYLACLAATAACADESDHTPLSFSIEGDRIVAVGEIDGTSLDTFEDIIDLHPNVQTLVLQYIGGSVDDEANVEFSRVVRDMGLTTVVPADGLVASGGTDLFLAGTTRIIESGACVGVHSWAAGDYTATDLSRASEEHDRYLEYYVDIDIDPDFYWFTIEAAPATGMHWMNANEVDEYSIATRSVTALSAATVCDNR